MAVFFNSDDITSDFVSSRYATYYGELSRMLMKYTMGDVPRFLDLVRRDNLAYHTTVPSQMNWNGLIVALDYAMEQGVDPEGCDVDYCDEVSNHTRQVIDWYYRIFGRELQGILGYTVRLYNMDVGFPLIGGGIGAVSRIRLAPRFADVTRWPVISFLQEILTHGYAPNLQFGPFCMDLDIRLNSAEVLLHPLIKRLHQFSFWKQLCFQGELNACDVFGFMGRLLAEHEETPYDVDDPDSPYRYWMRYEHRNDRKLAPKIRYES